MAETKKPSGVGGKTLTLKRSAETGVVRQSFSHGRTKAVVVEKVKRRVIGGSEPKPETAAAAPKVERTQGQRGAATKAATAAAAAASQAAPAPKPSRGVL